MPRRRGRRALQEPDEDLSSTTNGSADTALPMRVVSSSDAEWERLSGLLNGLLSVQVDSRYHHESHHANASWLVIHLTRVENPEPNCRHMLPKRMRDVLAALATLCAAAERLRLREPDQLAFWTRVLTSQMMARPLGSSDTTIEWFARHTREREARVKFKWSVRRLEKALLQPVEDLIDAGWAEYDRLPGGDGTVKPRCMKLAICVTNTQLIVKDLELLGDVIRPVEVNASTVSGGRLFDTSLSSLDISHTVLTVDMLRALASHVYPVARRIDELRLEAIFPSGPLGDATAVLTPQYAAAFKSVLAAALDVVHCVDHPHSVGISLAYNQLHVMHLQALFDSLRKGSRDLRWLSLQYALGSLQSWTPRLSDGLLKALEAIIFRTSNPSGRLDDDCELDLTGRTLQPDDIAVLTAPLEDRVKRNFPVVQQALAKRKLVTCRLKAQMVVVLPIDEEDDDDEGVRVMLRPDRDYMVTCVADPDKLSVVCPATESNQEFSGVVSARNITQLTVHGKHLFRPRFNRLILDGDVEERYIKHDVSLFLRSPNSRSQVMDVCGCGYSDLLQAIGTGARHVSMRWFRCSNRHLLAEMLSSCLRVAHVNIKGSAPFCHVDSNWLGLVTALPELASLDLTSTEMKSWMVEAFVRSLVRAPRLSLEKLSLARNQLSAENLQQLAFLVDVAAPKLQLLEVDSIGHSIEMEAYINARRELTSEHHGVVVDAQPLAWRAKLAFLSVAVRFCDGRAMEQTVAESIFAMVEQAIERRILWHGST